MNDSVLQDDVTLELTPANPSVGDKVVVRALKANGNPVDNEEVVLRQLKVQPEGVLRPGVPGEYEAVAAGAATVQLRVGGIDVNTTAQVSCPTVSSAVVTHTGQITGEVSWAASQGVHRVDGELHVRAGTLTIGACSKVEMAPGASIIVGADSPGRLTVRGTRENPIVFTTPAGSTGNWLGIRVHADRGANSELRWLTLRNADGLPGLTDAGERAVIDIVGASVIGNEPTIIVQGASIEGCADVGLRMRDFHVNTTFRWTDNTITGCGGHPISIDAGSLGAVSPGSYAGNGVGSVRVTGGWAGPNNQIWRNPGLPYEIESSIIIEPRDGPTGPQLQEFGGLRFVADADVTMKFHPASGIYVGRAPDRVIPEGTTLPWIRFSAMGALSRPVRFTSAQAAPAPGDWIGIVLFDNARTRIRNASDSGGSRGYDYAGQLRHAVIEYAGAPSGVFYPDGVTERRGGVIMMGQAPLAQGLAWILEGCTLRRNLGYGLVNASTPDLTVQRATTLPRRSGVRSCYCSNELGDISPVDDAMDPTVPASANCPCSGVRVWAD